MKIPKMLNRAGRRLLHDGFNNPVTHAGTYIKLGVLLLILSAGCKKTEVSSSGIGGQAIKAGGGLTTNFTPGPDFTIAVIPDPQYTVGYDDPVVVSHAQTSNLQMWKDEISWIINNKSVENIVYVAGLGDVADCGDDIVRYNGNTAVTAQWKRAADTGMYRLEAANIPYGMAVGNHEELPSNGSSTQLPTNPKTRYNQYFGYAHFSPFKYISGTPDATHYYGGAVDNSGANDVNHNDNHYDLFNAGGLGFIVIYLEYDYQNGLVFNSNSPVYNWADNLMSTYSSRKAIVVTHYAGHGSMNSTWDHNTQQATMIYDKLKHHSNFFMFLGGHVSGDGFKQIMYNGRSVKTYITDYQFEKGTDGKENGGAGYLRLMKFSVINDNVTVRTFSPYIINNPGFPDSVERFRASSHFQRPLFHDPVTTRTNDYSNDGKTDLAFFNAGTWKVNGLSNGSYGLSGDIPTPADYNGDGIAEHAIFRPSAGQFYVEGPTPDVIWGVSGDIPVPGDYNGDGRCDFAVYRPSNTTWYVKIDSINTDASLGTHAYKNITTVYGASTDIPVPGDYDGDGIVDYALWRPSTFHWYIKGQSGYDWGTTGDIPVPGDYFGDGKTDGAVFRPSTGEWYIHNETAHLSALVAPQSGDIPAPGDYDGLGRTQPAVWRPSTHTLYIGHWTNFSTWSIANVTTVNYVSFVNGDKLLNLPYHIRKFFFP